MKQLLFLALILSAISLQAADHKQEIKSDVDKAIVFLNGAQVYRDASINLKSGSNSIIFTGLSPYVNPNSIQVKIDGKFNFLDAKFRTFYPKPVEAAVIPGEVVSNIQKTQDELDMQSFDFSLINANHKALEKEKQMLWNNKLMNSQGGSDSLPILSSAMNFFALQIHDLDKKIIENRKTEFLMKKKQAKLHAKLAELKQYKAQFERNMPAPVQYQIVVDVHSAVATSGKLQISYVVTQAGWKPAYDVRVNGIDDPMNFTYKAQVYQRTGIDWKNVKLTVSTSNPFAGKLLPVFNPVFVQYSYPRPQGAYGNYDLNQVQTTNARPESTKGRSKITSDEVSEADFDAKMIRPIGVAQIDLKPVHVEFESRLKHSVPADGQNHMIILKDYEIDAIFDHVSLPRMQEKAHLIAKIKDWEMLNLLPGQANLFLEDTYVGRTALNPMIAEDTLQISMGVDEGVYIDRKKLSCSSSTNLLNTRKTKIYTYEITVRNNKNAPINLALIDQAPISKSEEIEVELMEAKKGKFDPSTGKIKWDLSLAAKESKKIILKYKVEFANGKVISGV